VRDQIVDFVSYWSGRVELPAKRLVNWIGISPSKYFAWRDRYGRVTGHNAAVPRDHWLAEWEKQAIIRYAAGHPLDGYRRLAFMMLDEDVVAVSPASVYRVLSEAGLIGRRAVVPSRKGRGFEQPLQPHEHWHVDVSYINVSGTFYYLCAAPGRLQSLCRHLGTARANDRA
jgi:putative transposase